MRATCLSAEAGAVRRKAINAVGEALFEAIDSRRAQCELCGRVKVTKKMPCCGRLICWLCEECKGCIR